MSAAVWLIAGREFRAYVATASFWVALAVGPVVMAGGVLIVGAQQTSAPRADSLTLTQIGTVTGGGAVEARFSPAFPLSAAGRAQILDVIQRDGALKGPVREAPPAPAGAITPAAISRFVTAMMLWMTLTGSLGMLLQAVVRERANRALESLLAATGPVAVVFGKLIGVGAVSALVMSAWLGSSALMVGLSLRAGGLAGALLQGMAHPSALARDAGLYVMAYAFYGLTTVAIGARARDNADAQNLARPMFAVLLAAFFATLAATGGASRHYQWLVYLPPFTPFMLLIEPRAPVVELGALAILAAACVAAAVLAVRATSLDSPKAWRARPATARPAPG